LPRPRKRKIVRGCPPVHTFKPAGVRSRELEISVLSHEEFEAVRLADREGLSQEEGAGKMGISRATFGRLLNSAHRIIADALVEGKALTIEGGAFSNPDEFSPGSYGPGRCTRRRRFRGGG